MKVKHFVTQKAIEVSFFVEIMVTVPEGSFPNLNFLNQIQDVIKWMYLHNIVDAGAKVTKLLEAAEYFQIAGLKELCGLILMDQVAVNNCMKMLDLACKYDIKNLKVGWSCKWLFLLTRNS